MLTILYLALLMAVLVFLPNRFDVPYAAVIGGWEVYPVTLLVGISPILVWSAGRLFGRRRARVPGFAPAVFFGFILCGLGSTLAAEEGGGPRIQGIVALATVALWTVPFWFLYSLTQSRLQIRVLLYTFLALALLAGGTTFLTALGREGIRALLGERLEAIAAYTNPRGGLPLGASTVIGAFYLMAVPHAYERSRTARFRAGRWAAAVVLAVSLLGGMATASRSSMGLLVLSTLVCATVFGMPGKRSGQLAWLALAAFLLGIAGWGFLKMSDRAAVYDASVEWRRRGAEVALEAVRDRPYLGHGVEAVFKREEGTLDSNLFSEKVHDAIVYDYRISPREPHNLYLMLASETGFLGLGLFLAFLASIGLGIARAAASAGNPEDRRAAVAFLIGFAGVLLHSLSGSDLIARARLASLFWIYCGLGLAWAQILRQDCGTANPPQKLQPGG